MSHTATTITTTTSIRRRINVCDVDWNPSLSPIKSTSTSPSRIPIDRCSDSIKSSHIDPHPFSSSSSSISLSPSRQHSHRKSASCSTTDSRKKHHRLSWSDHVDVLHFNERESVIKGAQFLEPRTLASFSEDQIEDTGIMTDIEDGEEYPGKKLGNKNTIPFPTKSPIEQWAQSQLNVNARKLHTHQRVRQRARSDLSRRAYNSLHESRGSFVRQSFLKSISEEDRKTVANEEMGEDELLNILEKSHPEEPAIHGYRRARSISVASTLSEAVSFGTDIAARATLMVGGALLSATERPLNTNSTLSGLHIRRRVRTSLLACAEAGIVLMGVLAEN